MVFFHLFSWCWEVLLFILSYVFECLLELTFISCHRQAPYLYIHNGTTSVEAQSFCTAGKCSQAWSNESNISSPSAQHSSLVEFFVNSISELTWLIGRKDEEGNKRRIVTLAYFIQTNLIQEMAMIMKQTVSQCQPIAN